MKLDKSRGGPRKLVAVLVALVVVLELPRITGPVDRKMIINKFDSDANAFTHDDETANPYTHK